MEALNNINIEEFVGAELEKKGFVIKAITEKYLHARIEDIMNFVNDILQEYQNTYPLWEPKPKEWFTNPLDRKFMYSYLIEDLNGEIAFFNFSSVYNELLHNHCSYTGKAYRGKDLAKLHMLKIADQALSDGFEGYEGYWDKHNNGSLILHLKMGFKIEDMRKQEQLYLLGEFKELRKKTYHLYKRSSSAKNVI